MFWDRRKGDRRADKDKPGKTAHEPDRRGDEGTAERRRWTCGILYKTSIPIRDIETWLEGNAEGEWAVRLDSIDEGLSSKVIKIMFEIQDDKLAFIEAFRQRQR